jgi:hypothetical protein
MSEDEVVGFIQAVSHTLVCWSYHRTHLAHPWLRLAHAQGDRSALI